MEIIQVVWLYKQTMWYPICINCMYFVMIYLFISDFADDDDFKTLLAGGNTNASLTHQDVSNISIIGEKYIFSIEI